MNDGAGPHDDARSTGSERRPSVLHLICADRPAGFTGATAISASSCVAAGRLANQAPWAAHRAIVIGSARDADDASRLGCPHLAVISAPLGRAPLAIRKLADHLDRETPDHIVTWSPFASHIAATAGWYTSATTELVPLLTPRHSDPNAKAAARKRLGIAQGETVILALADHPGHTTARPAAYAASIAALELREPVTVLVSTAIDGATRVAEHMAATQVPCGMILSDHHPAVLLPAADAAVFVPRIRPAPADGDAALRLAAHFGVPACCWQGDVPEAVAESEFGNRWLAEFPEHPLIGSCVTHLLSEPGTTEGWLSAASEAWQADTGAQSHADELADTLGHAV